MANVTVNLPRVISFRATASEPEFEYGPGIVSVPQELADKLKEWGWNVESAKGAAPDPWIANEKLVPSQELPASFPSREYLFMAGHHTYGNVAELTPQQVVDLPGIGEARAAKINDAIKEVQKRLPVPVLVVVEETQAPSEPAAPAVPRRSGGDDGA